MTGDTRSQKLADLKIELRSLLLPWKRGCNERQLMKDYATHNEGEIPFREMGFNNLLELLSSMPDAAYVDYRRSPAIIHGVADQNTHHIQKLVMNQKWKEPPQIDLDGRNRNHLTSSKKGSSMHIRHRQVDILFLLAHFRQKAISL